MEEHLGVHVLIKTLKRLNAKFFDSPSNSFRMFEWEHI
ncbi:hypothetical protein LEP1GSC029_0230 [Leptospira interrogans str. 2002000626]|uniref:Uncharacterized protein n=1 Tax=Leptospira interrogans str. 2002000626 TaxID=996803 RepID=A0A829D2M8_LEPIR|nr:hypothetical protein LEP1GSC029_0230 [Leptospira interrogans str. 2002000626]